MTCQKIPTPGGGVAIICERGRPRHKPCSVTGCRSPGEFACDYPLRGAKAGATCSRLLCKAHAIKQDGELDFCPSHDTAARIEREKEVP